MKYKIIISDRSKRMLGNHVVFLANKNPEAARKLQKRLMQTIRSLESMPSKYPFIDEEYIPRGKYHKLFIENWYLVLYQIQGDTVFVDYIVDCRQDYSWLIR